VSPACRSARNQRQKPTRVRGQPCRFFLLGRDVDGGEGARAIEDGELAGIASIRFDAIAWPAQDQRRCDHITRNVVPGQRALELKATRSCFIAALNRSGAQRLDESQNWPPSRWR